MHRYLKQVCRPHNEGNPVSFNTVFHHTDRHADIDSVTQGRIMSILTISHIGWKYSVHLLVFLVKGARASGDLDLISAAKLR